MAADYDVVIIGSGVAGAICAAGFASSGKKILILEAGENGLGAFQREQYRRTWDPVPGKSWNTPYLRNAGIKNYPSPGPGTPDKTVYLINPMLTRLLKPSKATTSASSVVRLGLGGAIRLA